MVSNTPEYLVDEVLKQYGITVPLEKAIIYLECDPYLTPETLFRYVISEEDIIVGNDDEAPCDDEQRGDEVKIPNEKGYTVVDLAMQNSFEIPLGSGCYIWLLKDSCSFPEPDGMVKPVFNITRVRGKKYRVLYTGKAKSLHKRLNGCHLNGNIACSTLRKSIAALNGFAFEHYLSGNTPKVKISPSQETQISMWLVHNCVLMFKEYVDIDAMEQKLIKILDPPLNIDGNPYEHNSVYIGQLKALRRTGGSFKTHSIGTANRNAGIESLWNSMGNAGKVLTILGALILFFDNCKVMCWLRGIALQQLIDIFSFYTSPFVATPTIVLLSKRCGSPATSCAGLKPVTPCIVSPTHHLSSALSRTPPTTLTASI